MTYIGSERLVQHSLQAYESGIQDLLYTHGRGTGRKGVWGTVGRTKRAMSLQNVKDPPEDLEPCLFTDALCHQQLCCLSPPPLPFLLRIPHRYRVSPSLASLSLP